jgi:pimeloyl-ACP methyl ester carboxylesterase
VEHAFEDRIRLPDGRMLGFAEYGDRRGLPIINCHGAMSSRLDVAFAAPLCAEKGVRLLSPDRPGIGLSDPRPGRTMLDWADDVRVLADALGLGRFAVFGWSGGGPYAFACGARLDDRVTKIGTVGAVASLERPEAARRLGLWADRMLFPLAMRAPRIAAVGLTMARRIPAEMLRQTLLRELPSASDRAVIGALSAKEATGFFYEALRSGARGVVEDYRVLGSPWGFELGRLKSEVILWQGEEDTLSPIEHAHRLAEQIPRARLIVLPGRGHFLLRPEMPRILEELVS